MEREAIPLNQLATTDDPPIDWTAWVDDAVPYNMNPTDGSLILDRICDPQHDVFDSGGMAGYSSNTLNQREMQPVPPGLPSGRVSHQVNETHLDEDEFWSFGNNQSDLPAPSQPDIFDNVFENTFESMFENNATYSTSAPVMLVDTPLGSAEKPREPYMTTTSQLGPASAPITTSRANTTHGTNEIQPMRANNNLSVTRIGDFSLHQTTKQDKIPRQTKTSRLLGTGYTVQALGPRSSRKRKTTEGRNKNPCLKCKFGNQKCCGGYPCIQCQTKRTRLEFPRLYETDCVSADTKQFNPFAYDDFDHDCSQEAMSNPLMAKKGRLAVYKAFEEMFSQHQPKDFAGKLANLQRIASFAALFSDYESPSYSDIFDRTSDARTPIQIFIMMNRLSNPMGAPLLTFLAPQQVQFVRACRYAASAAMFDLLETISNDRAAVSQKVLMNRSRFAARFIIVLFEGTNTYSDPDQLDSRRDFLRLYLTQTMQQYEKIVGGNIMLNTDPRSLRLAPSSFAKDMDDVISELRNTQIHEVFEKYHPGNTGYSAVSLRNLVPHRWITLFLPGAGRHPFFQGEDLIQLQLWITNLFESPGDQVPITKQESVSRFQWATWALIRILFACINIYDIAVVNMSNDSAQLVRSRIAEHDETCFEDSGPDFQDKYQHCKAVVKRSLEFCKNCEECKNTSSRNNIPYILPLLESLCRCSILLGHLAEANITSNDMYLVLAFWSFEETGFRLGLHFLTGTTLGAAVLITVYPKLFLRDELFLEEMIAAILAAIRSTLDQDESLESWEDPLDNLRRECRAKMLQTPRE